MGMVGEACLPSNAYYPRTNDYTLYSGVHVFWFEHSLTDLLVLIMACVPWSQLLPSICPDPLVIPCLARTCKRKQCPIWSLKVYLKLTCSYRQNRTRVFFPNKGNQDFSKAFVSRWVSYTFKLAYKKLIRRNVSFLKIIAHEVRALSSAWALFDIVPLNE